jgi:D-glycero-D-manno-heptose 1,7-bisphosphate phosphatase
MRPAVFLDRDGVLNVYLPGEYVRTPDELELLPSAAPAVRTLNDLGLPAYVISNQQGVAKGLMTGNDLARVDAALHERLAAGGARVERSYYCPHHKDYGCDCRKPLPGLLLRAAAENGIDLPASFFVGDTETDAKAARAAGVGAFVLVLSGKIRDAAAADDLALFPVPPDHVAADLAGAAAWIAERVSGRSRRTP